MKHFTLALLIISLALLVGCADPNNSQSQEKTPETTTDTQAQKIALYSRIIGTYEEDIDSDSTEKPRIFNFQMDSITLNGVKYHFNPLTDLQIPERLPEHSHLPEQFILHFNNTDYPVQFPAAYQPEEKIYITINDDFRAYYKVTHESDSDTPSTPLDFSLVGNWNYTINNMQSTTLTIADNNTFSFNKNNAITSGTYTLTGNKITFDYQTTQSSNQVKVTDTFTITGNESEITLTLVESISNTNGNETTSTSMSSMLLQFYQLVSGISIKLTK